MIWIKAIIEIALLFLAIYALMRALHGTRGEKIIRGYLTLFVILFAILFILAKICGLHRMEYLLDHFCTIYLFAMVIIFQPELRAGLIRLGRNPFVNILFQQKAEVVEEIIGAVAFLAKRKVGALIVIERSVKLGNIIANGVRLDAEVTKALLSTIFWPGSPLHDGAVIIRDQRIIAARCVLPLTEKGDLSHTLGTRHRAAIGVTEESDAVVLVVSEERGVISVALRGNLQEEISLAQLRKMMTTILGEMEQISEQGDTLMAREKADTP